MKMVLKIFGAIAVLVGITLLFAFYSEHVMAAHKESMMIAFNLTNLIFASVSAVIVFIFFFASRKLISRCTSKNNG